MTGYLMEAAGLLLRWLHVIAAIAWIGESFYFVALDNGLKKPKPGTAPDGVAGESWSVHGGGFYHKQKYLVSPAQMPEELHWSKWKAYTTWLSGFALFGAMYLSQPQLYLVDPSVMALSPHVASALAVGFLLFGWLVYDGLCRLVGMNDRLLGVLVAVFVLAVDIAATHLFSGRAAFLITGAVMATIMSANVFFVIIPGQKRMVAALTDGQVPNPLDGKRGKQRSVHNTYFTLPVVFVMISNHYASTYAHPWNWAILALWMAAGALIRQFFVLWHRGQRVWSLPVCGVLLIVAALLWMRPVPPAVADAEVLQRIAPIGQVRTASAAGTSAPDASVAAATPAAAATGGASAQAVLAIVAQRCQACHSSHPTMMPTAPFGLTLDTVQDLQTHAAQVYQQSVQLKAMPLGNVTQMTDDERATIARWHASNPQ